MVGMIKYILLALLVAILAFGGWFWMKTDPQKLDFVDRVAPGKAEYGWHRLWQGRAAAA
jgi:hypothetical protein